MSKKNQIPEVPVLDKGDYNNKRNLLYFLEQEKLAKKMIEEANAFYNSFLISKTTRFEDILKYPNVFFVKPKIYAFYRKAVVEKDKYGSIHCGVCQGAKDKLAITVSFDFDFGTPQYGSSFSHCFNSIIKRYKELNEWKYYSDKPPKNLYKPLKTKRLQ